MKDFSFKLVWKSLKDSFSEFGKDKITKLSASLAYYTAFSLAPLLVVIIAICGLVFGQQAIEGTLEDQIGQIVGPEAAAQIETMIKNATLSGGSVLATVIGFATLLISATTIFSEMQDSINSIWGLKLKPSAGIKQTITTRLLSFGVVGGLGFILLVSLLATTLVESLGDRLKTILPGGTVAVIYIINLLLTLTVTAALFAVIFKVLPDVNVKWKAVIPGAIFTALLFMVGKFGISLYVSNTDIGSSYGAAGSFAVLLIWIYFSSIILYFGAEFTKAYIVNMGWKIRPDKYAEWADEPTVPGGEPKKSTGSSPSEKNKRQQKEQHIPPMAALAGDQQNGDGRPEVQRVREDVHDWKIKPGQQQPKRKNNKPGMGKALIGLALYLATKGNDKKRGS